jgi:hypothetical protein
MAVNTIYIRPLDEVKTLLEPLYALKPLTSNSSNLPWKDIPDAALYGGIAANCFMRPYYVPYTATLHAVDIAKLIRTINYVNATVPKDLRLQSSLVTFTQYAAWGFAQRPGNFSAFPYREPTIFAQVDGITTNASFISAISSFGSRVRDLLLQDGSTTDSSSDSSDSDSPVENTNNDTFPTAEPLTRKNMKPVYTHFAHGDEGPESWYTAEKLPYLRELKRRFDSDGVFGFYNPIS